MSAHEEIRLLPDLPTPKPNGRPRPLYVCPGIKDVPVPHAIFPYGSGFTESRRCALRDCCYWFAPHDLGGTSSILDFPDEAILPANFRPFPFYCSSFRSLEPRRRKKKAAANRPKSAS